MNIDFIADSHTYLVDGEVASVSVTELLHKHGIAPDYSGVSADTLKAKSNRGKEIHEGLAKVVSMPKYTPETAFEDSFQKWCKSKSIIGARAEQPLAYIFGGFILAGTCDLLGITANNELFIADHKIMKKVDKNYVAWQVSIYDYFLRKLDGKKLNNDTISWKGASKFYCLNYDPELGTLTEIPLEKVSDTEIERLISCEMQGKVYSEPKLVAPNGLMEQVDKAESLVLQLKSEIEVAEKRAKEFRELVLQLMQEQGVKSWETDKVKLTLVAEYTKATVDSKKLKTKYEKAYMDCLKSTKVKASLKITAKGEEKDE